MEPSIYYLYKFIEQMCSPHYNQWLFIISGLNDDSELSWMCLAKVGLLFPIVQFCAIAEDQVLYNSNMRYKSCPKQGRTNEVYRINLCVAEKVEAKTIIELTTSLSIDGK